MATSVLHSPTNPHFLQPLLPGFHSHLSIPLKFFSEHIEGRNEKDTVELESDACENPWKVKMEGLRLTAGWKEFTNAHDFRIGDILIFRHEGDLVLHVTSFGPSCCELQYEQDNTSNLSTRQYLKTEPKSCFIARVTDSNLREDTLFFPKQFFWFDGLNKGRNKIILSNEGARTWTLVLKFRESTRTFYMRGGWRRFCHDNGFEPGDSITFKLESNKTRTPLLRFSSAESKRVPTKHSSKGKKRKTGESSQTMSSSSSLSENRFVTLTVTSNDLNQSRLRLPSRFTRVNQMEKAGGKKIILRDKNGEEWPVNLLMYRGYMYLGSGTKRFLNAIGIKASESFVLELVWEGTTTPPLLKLCSQIKT